MDVEEEAAIANTQLGVSPFYAPLCPAMDLDAPLGIPSKALGLGGDDLSGGAFDPRTCHHYFFRNGPNSFEEYENDLATHVRTVTLTAYKDGWTDTEGGCYYHDGGNGVSKLVIADERDRSIGICTPLPLDDHAADPKMFRQNCEVVSMTSDQVNQTSSDENKGFEGVACDAVDQRLYVITERDPMSIWTIDMTQAEGNRSFEVRARVQRGA